VKILWIEGVLSVCRRYYKPTWLAMAMRDRLCALCTISYSTTCFLDGPVGLHEA
jgi:hypothetical protein